MVAFIGSHLKLKRARQHIEELRTLFRQHFEDSPITGQLGHVDECEDGTRDVTFTVNVPEHPEMAPTIIGDVVHNMRTALDHMASEMARNNGQPDSGVYFPFAGSEVGLEEMIKRKQFHRCGDDAIELLRPFKPYKQGNIELTAIHDLDVLDKHRDLIPQGEISTHTDGPEVTNEHASWVDPKFWNSVYTFPTDGELAGREIVPTLETLVDLCEDILNAFAAAKAAQK